jgi:uncharacterized membrane protein YhaH (DUF805 family)
MGFGEAVASCFNKYASFSGRAPRSEYWWWFLFVFLVSLGVGLVSGILDIAMGSKMPGFVARGTVDLILLLPNIAVGVRRLHDLNRSGWWLGASMIMGAFLLTLLVPVLIRMAENHTNGYAATYGITPAVFIVMGLLGLVEGIYGLVLFVWFCMGGTRGANRFGADPLRAF